MTEIGNAKSVFVKQFGLILLKSRIAQKLVVEAVFCKYEQHFLTNEIYYHDVTTQPH